MYELSSCLHSINFNAFNLSSSLEEIIDSPSIRVDVSLPPTNNGAITTFT